MVLIGRLLLVGLAAFFILWGLFRAPPLSAKDDRIVEVVETVSKAIVNIKTEEWSGTGNEVKKPDSLKRLFANTEEDDEVFENIGSGVVLDPKGIIVTNEHLIAKASAIRVKFINGKEYDAFVLGSDPEFDIALLKVSAEGDFPYLKVNRRSPGRVGERAIVIGNPYGLASSVTMGVVSALGRNIRIDNRVYVNLVQTDASINPGNSGGALLDVEGNLLGIVTAIYGEGKGIGFAIPAEDVMNMLSEFLTVDVKRPILGLFIEKRKNEKGSYLHVNGLIPGSPAERRGVKIGDRIVELNRRKIKEGMKLQGVLRAVKPGALVQFKVARGTRTFIVSLDMEELDIYRPSPLDENLCGFRVSDIKLYQKLKHKLKDKEGAVVAKVYPGGLAEKSGLRPGDVIVKVNTNVVLDKKGFESYMEEGLRRNYILFQIRRNENVFFLPVKLDTLL